MKWLKEWWKKFRIPKTLLGLVLLGVGFYYKNDVLINWGLSLLGVGFLSKLIKKSQGNSMFNHERHLFKLFQPKKEM